MSSFDDDIASYCFSGGSNIKIIIKKARKMADLYLGLILALQENSI